MFILMAHEQDIAARLDGLHSHITKGIVFSEGPHVHIVGNNNTLIAHILTKPVGDDFLRETRRIIWINLRIHRMRYHNHICVRFRLLNEIYKYLCILSEQGIFRCRYNARVRMQIHIGFTNAWKMLVRIP